MREKMSAMRRQSMEESPFRIIKEAPEKQDEETMNNLGILQLVKEYKITKNIALLKDLTEAQLHIFVDEISPGNSSDIGKAAYIGMLREKIASLKKK